VEQAGLLRIPTKALSKENIQPSLQRKQQKAMFM